MEEEGGINLYGMVGNDNINEVDILGQCKRGQGGVKGPQGHHIIPFEVFAQCCDTMPICIFLDSSANLLRHDDWNGHRGANSIAYTAAIKAIISKVSGGKHICDLDATTLQRAIDMAKRSQNPAIKDALDKINDKIEQAAKNAAKKAEKQAAEQAAKEGSEGLLKKSAKKVAKFAGKKVPLVGWGFAAKGAWDGWNEGEGFWDSAGGAVSGALW
jgi:hypothetical protein